MSEVKFLDLYKQYMGIKDEIDSAISSVIGGSAFIGGSFVNDFETQFAAFTGSSHCVSVGNGTDALEIAIESLELPPGSEIIVPANSFIATSEAVTRSGHTVVFADCGPDYLIDVDHLRARVTSRTRAVIPVHLYGQMCDMEAIRSIANESEIYVIEDAAQAHGATFKGKPVGTDSDLATYSFYPGKNLGAYGDGGAITCNDADLARKSRMVANHGRIDKYDHEFEGRNSRLDGLQAAVLSVKLRHLPKWIERRRRCADLYMELLGDTNGIELPVVAEDRGHVFHLYVIRTRRRDELREFLRSKGIQSGVHYPCSLPSLAAYAYLRNGESTPNADKYAEQLLSLPMGEHLSDNDVWQVASRVRKFFE